MFIEYAGFMWDVTVIMALMIGILVVSLFIWPPAIYVVVRATISYLKIKYQDRFEVTA